MSGISAQGSIIKINTGTNATPVWTKINGLLSFDGFDGGASDIDTTDLDSTAMEYISGLRDEGKFNFEVKNLHTDPGQVAIEAAQVSGALTGMQLTLPDASIATFHVLVKTTPISGGVNAMMKSKISTKISGLVVWS